MAIKIIAQASYDIQSLCIEGKAIASLMLWINEARALTDKLRGCAQIDPDLAECLMTNDIRFKAAEWEDDVATGMDMLILSHRASISEILDAAIAMEKARHHG